jgi:4'-phosphopantetheinyl transferase
VSLPPPAEPFLPEPATDAAPRLWLADLDAEGPWLEALDRERPLLADADRARLSIGPSAASRRQRLRAHLALRAIIVACFGRSWRAAPYEVAPGGRIGLADLGGSFSLAHTGAMALIGIARRATIGVDLEAPRTVGLEARRRDLIEAAAGRLAPCGPLPAADAGRRFLTAWVRLEALGKADGRGVGHVLGALGAWSGGRTAAAGEAPSAFFDVYDLDVAPPLVAAAALTRGTPAPAAAVEAFVADPVWLQSLLGPT